MRKLCWLTVLIVLAAPVAGQAGEDDVLGVWLTEPGDDGRAHVEITRDGRTFSGRIVWLEKPVYDAGGPRPGEPRVDLNNPDPDLRERPVLGLPLLEGFTYNGRGTWVGGTIYDPSNGKTYTCKMWLEDDDTLKVRGYVGVPLLGRSAVWTRVQEPSGEHPTSAGVE